MARGRGRPRTGVREAILRTASEVLTERGVAGLTTREIANRAGVAESSIFYHFKDRLGLLRAIASGGVPAFADLIKLRETNEPTTLQASLRQLLEALESLYLQVIPVQAATLSDPELRAIFSQQTDELDLGPHRALRPTVNYLEADRGAGLLRTDVDLQAVALMIMGAAHQRALQQVLGAARGRLPSVANLAATLATAMTPSAEGPS